MSELYHHGIKGQRWGVRRYQNEDGTYTAEGKAWRQKQQERINKYSHGTNNFRSAKREVTRRAGIRNVAASGSIPAGLLTGATIGGIVGGPAGASVGMAVGYGTGFLITAGYSIVNSFKTQKMLNEMQDYAESSKKYADQIISQTGDMQVSDIINKK